MASASKLSLAPPKKNVPLAVIDPDHETSSVIVRVLRKWHVFGNYGGNKPIAVELVMVDTEGTKIQGHIDQMNIYKLDKIIQEGSVYHITKFIVALNAGGYRVARHEYKLNLNIKTVIRPTPEEAVPFPEYCFTDPEQCFQSGFNRDYLVDVAGMLTGVGVEQVFYKNNIKTSRMQIELENRGYRFNVTLFGNYVNELNAFVGSGNSSNVVIAILYCKVSKWQGGTSIQTTMHTTKLLVNPDIPESAALREAIDGAITSPTLTVSQYKANQGEEVDFLTCHQKYSIADIKEMIEESDFVVLATINSIVNDDNWWYWACRCNKKVVDDTISGMFYCPKCDTHVTKVTHKYLLKLRIIDESDSLTVVLFEHTASVLTGKSCEQVIQSWEQDPDRDYLPIEVQGLKGKEALFRIQCEGMVGGRFPRSYRVKNVSDDLNLKQKYKAKWIEKEASVESSQQVLLIENTSTDQSGSVQNDVGGLAQDLMDKFVESASDSTTVGSTKETVDITTDTLSTPPLKRKNPTDAGSASSSISLKSVKIEK